MTVRGTTAPSLLQELLQYDPRLAQDGSQQAKCRHDYTTNYNTSTLPKLDERPDQNTSWAISCVCQRCRCHLSLSIDFRACFAPCPNSDFPLHHFLLQPDSDATNGIFNFRCSASNCQAVLCTGVRQPILSPQDVFLLTDTQTLHARFERAAVVHPELQEQKPINSLKTFASYIRDSLLNDSNKKVPVQNKRFMISLGSNAGDLLERLGFTHTSPDKTIDNDYWFLPKPVDSTGQVTDIDLKTLLENTRDELGILMKQRPEPEKFSAGELSQWGTSSMKDLERILGTLDCAYPIHTPVSPLRSASMYQTSHYACLRPVRIVSTHKRPAIKLPSFTQYANLLGSR